MDDWSSPWADDAEKKEQVVPEPLAPAPPKNSLRDAILGTQSTGNSLTSFKDSSPWGVHGGFTEWSKAVVEEDSENIMADAFPDWTTEASSKVVSSFNGTKEGTDGLDGKYTTLWEDNGGNGLELLPANLVEGVPWDSTGVKDTSARPLGNTGLSIEAGHKILAPQLSQERIKDVRLEESNVGDTEKAVDLESTVPPTNHERGRVVSEQRLSGTNTTKKASEGDLSSGPSSSPSSEQDIGQGAVDSPRTSLEEQDIQSEAQKEAPFVPQGPSQLIPNAPLAGHVDDFDNGDDEFGEFEEEREYVDNAGLEQEPSPVASLPRIQPAQDPAIAATPGSLRHTNVATFEVNMSLLDDFFPKELEVVDPPDVSDDIISSMSNRRTWYRISRRGTMKEHDSGDENYVRATWVGSSIQAKLNEIVARWITEDRIAGGVALGSGKTLGAMFGWGEDARGMQAKKHGESKTDPDTPPPSSSHHKKLTSKPATVSLPLAIPGLKLHSASNSPITASTSSAPSDSNPLAPNFGWSTSKDRSQGSALSSPQGRNAVPTTPTRSPISVAPPSPFNPASCPSPNARPMSMYISGKRDPIHTRGSKSVDGSSGIRTADTASPRHSTPATGQGFGNPLSTTSTPADIHPSAANENLHVFEGHGNPWASADLSTFEKALSPLGPPSLLGSATALIQLKSLNMGNKDNEFDEDGIMEKIIKGLPDLLYMLKR